MASGSGDNTIRLWNADTGKHLQTLKGHTSLVKSVVFSHDGNIIASASGVYHPALGRRYRKTPAYT
ncbi:MAG: hypothetical protein OXP71_05450 [Candidatus Poribacteria bacterium]|nr:hypothetical protein [Candidatus Poribacteria bacterium]